MTEMPGTEAALVAKDEVSHLDELLDTAAVLNQAHKALVGKAAHNSPKVKDKQKNRSKAKKAKASRKANRG